MVYPVPAHDALHLSWPGSGPATVRVLNTKGQVLLEKQARQGRERLGISTLPPGVYGVQVQTQASLYRVKFVKQ